MEFQKRKSAALAAMNSTAPDKSPKGNIDAPIVPLLTAINSHPSYFTTSSCSGRISILSQPAASPSAAKKKARGGSWLLVSHEPVHPSSVSALLFPSPSPADDHVDNQSVVFRFEPLIIAVESESVEAAQSLVSLAISCGFRESGITSVSKRTIIAIRCSIRLEVPLGNTQKLMVSREYVEYLVDLANEKMGTNRKRTDLFFDKLMENGFPGRGEIISNGEETCMKAKGFGVLGSSEENEMEVLEGQLGPQSKYNRSNMLCSKERIELQLLKGVAYRVCLGLIPSSACSWVTGVTALRDEGGVLLLHIHGNMKKSEEGLWTKHVVQTMSDIAESEGRLWEASVEHVERVKWYAPHIRHLVVDVTCKLSQT